MSTDPRPGMARFKGAPAVFFMAVCQNCDIALPFETDAQRWGWTSTHIASHVVEFAVDIRPDPRMPFAFITRETLQQTQQWLSQQWYHSSDRNPLLAQQTNNQVVSMESDEKPVKIDPKQQVGKDGGEKLNARDRRRLRRKDKQRNDT